MKKLIFFSSLAVILLFASCEDEIGLNADYKDITIIHGLLDPSVDTTFLKINKAFLGEGNVLEMAQIEDSSIYKTDLSASVMQIRNSEVINTYPFDAIVISDKEPGTFYNPNQTVFYSTMDINEDDSYMLNITIGNKEVTAETPIVNYFTIERPSAGAAFVRIRYDNDYTVRWNSAKNGRRYEVFIRFNFRELFQGSTDTVSRSMDWALGTQKSQSINGGEDMITIYSGTAFFNWIDQNIRYNSEKEATVVARFTESLEYIINVAGEELNTFMEVNEPSSSIVQDKPEYTNINNGLGIFSSRLRQTRVKKIHPETVNLIQDIEPDLRFEY